jgi:hypothetical protein
MTKKDMTDLVMIKKVITRRVITVKDTIVMGITKKEATRLVMT